MFNLEILDLNVENCSGIDLSKKRIPFVGKNQKNLKKVHFNLCILVKNKLIFLENNYSSGINEYFKSFMENMNTG